MGVYFLFSLIGSQPYAKHEFSFVPIFLILQFIFFVGWLEVAEAIKNPFGNDEDDFHICQLVSRHLWAVGRNISLYEGPPDEGEDVDNDEGKDSVKININKLE